MLSRETITQYEAWSELFRGLYAAVTSSGKDPSTFDLAKKHAKESTARIAAKFQDSKILNNSLWEWTLAHFDLIETALRPPHKTEDAFILVRATTWKLIQVLAIFGWDPLGGFDERINDSVDAFIELLAARIEKNKEKIKEATFALKGAWRNVAGYASEWLV